MREFQIIKDRTLEYICTAIGEYENFLTDLYKLFPYDENAFDGDGTPIINVYHYLQYAGVLRLLNILYEDKEIADEIENILIKDSKFHTLQELYDYISDISTSEAFKKHPNKVMINLDEIEEIIKPVLEENCK